MRALPAPRPLARTTAVQPTTDPPTAQVITKRGSAQSGAQAKFLSRYQDWQSWARRYARQLGVARFSAGVVADTCSRCILRIEERDPNGDWIESEDPRLVGQMEGYSNPRQGAPELVRLHAWHKQVAGECAQVVMDGQGGVEWWIFSLAAIEWIPAQDGGPGWALVKLTPDGKERDGTAVKLPRNQIVRFWNPDEEWQAYATSPMAASIDDLHRYRSLARYAQRTADSALAMNGLLWAPSEAFEVDAAEQDDPGAGIETPQSPLERAYYDLAKLRFDDDDDVTSIAPALLKWDKALGAPVWVKIAEALDAAGIEHRTEALTDFARGTNLPASLVVGGGPGDGNHWTEWLVDDKFFASAVAPTMDSITHAELTQTYLQPLLRMVGITEPGGRYRVGYDPGPVIVKPDQSDQAIRLWLAGLLSSEATLEACNFDPDDLATPEDVDRLLEVLSRGAGQEPTTVTTPGGSVMPAGDARGSTSDVPPAAPQAALTAAAGDRPPTVARTNRLLAQLSRMQSALGRQLLAGAEVAYAEAVRRAGVKVQTRSRARKVARATDQAVQAAVASGGALGPLLAAVGVTEAELLQDAFSAYQDQARRWITDSQRRQRAAVERAGYDPAEMLPSADDEDRRAEAAAVLLAAGLLALARTRLVSGVDATVLGADGTPALAGEVTGAVPARLVTDALRVSEGVAHVTPGATPDQMPRVQLLNGARSPQQQLADRALADLRASRADALDRARETASPDEVAQLEDAASVDDGPQYVWRWGFYGEPNTAFEPHQDLGASDFTTSDPLGDPLLANTEAWPFGDFYQPGDHDGCTCEWEIVLPDGSGVAQMRLDAPELV